MAIPHSQSHLGSIPLIDVPTASKAELQQEGTHNLHMVQPQVIRETVSLGSTKHLLYKVILPKLGGIADLLNT